MSVKLIQCYETTVNIVYILIYLIEIKNKIHWENCTISVDIICFKIHMQRFIKTWYLIHNMFEITC